MESMQSERAIYDLYRHLNQCSKGLDAFIHVDARLKLCFRSAVKAQQSIKSIDQVTTGGKVL
jgi:hypothetical protein